MRTLIHLGNKPVTLESRDFDEEVDTDQLLSIDYSNLYGEAVTISALMNQVGILKSQAEKIYAEKKLNQEVYEGQLRQRFRKEAVATAVKITEAGLDEMVSIDPVYQNEKKNVINAQFNVSIVESLWWAVKSKDQKLNNLVRGVTPEDLFAELIDGTINNIILKKRKSITEIKK